MDLDSIMYKGASNHYCNFYFFLFLKECQITGVVLVSLWINLNRQVVLVSFNMPDILTPYRIYRL